LSIKPNQKYPRTCVFLSLDNLDAGAEKNAYEKNN
jgi:hypothetical protein